MSIDSEMPGVPKPAQENHEATKPTRQDKPKSPGLYDVTETNDGFEATLPGAWDSKREAIIGTRKDRFATREDAEAAVTQERESMRVRREKTSLEKTYSESVFRIDETGDGKFRVTLPGLKHEKGYYVGTSVSEYETWDEAKERFLATQEQEAELTKKPLLELQAGEGEKIAFSDLEAFNPRVAPSENGSEVPAAVRNYLVGEKDERQRNGMSTYEETVKEKDWERKLFSFVSSYLQEDAPGTLKELGITRLDALTPKQAIDLSTRVVIDLTKYKESDVEATEGHVVDASKIKKEKTAADKSTAFQLLQEGRTRKDDPTWEGNGVCRNFASTTKAVFEALKASQTRFSRLRDTYCTYENGYAFDPKREDDWGKLEVGTVRVSHAWNTFVTVSKEGGANATIVDATWGKRNLDTKKVEGLDHTLKRMEPVVFAVAENLPDSAPDRDAQVQHVLSYYGLKLAAGVNGPEEREFLVSRAVDLMKKQKEIGELPPSLVEGMNSGYKKLAQNIDASEMETVFKASKTNPGIDSYGILGSYLKDKRLTDYHAQAMIFKDDDLQRAVFEQVKDRPEFGAFLKESPAFRIRMREVVPQLFIDFSPETKPEDAKELQELLRRSGSLDNLASRINPNRLQAEAITRVFGAVREKLQALNPQRYDEVAAGLDDYQLAKQYNALSRELRS